MFDISRLKAKAPYKSRHDVAIGELLVESGNTAEGLRRYEQAAAIDPKSPLVHIGHAMALLRADLAQTGGRGDRPRTANPTHPIRGTSRTWHARGVVAGRLGDNTAAQLAMTSCPSSITGWYFNSQRDHVVAAIREASPLQSPPPKRGKRGGQRVATVQSIRSSKAGLLLRRSHSNAAIDRLAEFLDREKHKK